MFWGLIMEPQRRYTQIIKQAFHISMAALDVSNATSEPSQVMCTYEGRNYLLCTLEKPDKIQCSLDLYFEEGTEVSFAANGKSHVHLTGYLTKDDPAELSELEEEEEDEEVFEEDVKSKKQKKKQEGPIPKRSKTFDYLLNATTEDEDGDEEDSDVDMEKLLEQGSDEEEDDEDQDEEVEDSSDLPDAEESDEDEDESSDIEEEEEKPQSKMNGVKKAKKEPSTPKGKEKEVRDATPFHKGKKENGVPKKTDEKKKKTLPSGVIVEDIKEGEGNAVTNGKYVQVYYEGRLKQNNKVFDKTVKGTGFGFRLGKGEVIKGWDIGITGMKVGGKRRITCPPHVAYGAKGSPPVIPPNSTLIFEVELKKIK